jgi:diguanylate cyclase (GGDEF)-like protein
MAADEHNHFQASSKGTGPCLAAPALAQRVDEEIARAERHGTALSCLLVGVEDAPSLRREHGRELFERALAYVGLALRREFRRFDRVGRLSGHEHLVVLPGADGARGEVVARRTLARLRAIKLEVHGERSPLRVSVGIATWRQGLTAGELIAEARQAAGRRAAVESPLPVGPLGFP